MAQNYFGTIDLVRHIEITNAIAQAMSTTPANIIGRQFYYNAVTRDVFLEKDGKYVKVATLLTDPIGSGTIPTNIFRGDWVSDIAYTPGQIVHRNGIDWIAAYQNVGEEPGMSMAWRRLVSVGVPQAWAAGMFNAGVIVSHEGKFYLAKVDTSNGPPDTSPDWVETLSAGPMGLPGEQGVNGFAGWAPLLAAESDGLRRVIKVIGWVGGEGAPPALLGYLGPDGLTDSIALAIDFRGATGPSGPAGGGDGGGSSGAGWTPELAGEVDGTRRVLRVVDWVGGTGDKPAVGVYVGTNGFVSEIANAVDFRGGAGPSGPAGLLGPRGWAPILAAVADGERRVFRVVGWVGGEDDPPAEFGYLGVDGLVADIAQAVDVRGPAGPSGPAGAGSAGATGDAGWSPLLAAANDDNRRVLRVVGWTGGQGEPPATSGYLGVPGIVQDIDEAIDFRGPVGPSGPGGGIGFKGWSPRLASEQDGLRSVLRVIGWVGGEGDPPPVSGYLGAAGIVPNVADATDFRGVPGAGGTAGTNGWSPVLAAAVDGERRVLRVVSWLGGEGDPPTTLGFLGPNGIVQNVADAVDFQGIQGIQGNQGVQGIQGIQGVQGPEGPPDVLTEQYRNETLAARDEVVAAAAEVADDVIEADASAQLARDWAAKPVDQVVADGEYSAKHHATQANVASGAAISVAGALNTALAGFTDRPLAVGMRRVASFVVSGNDALVVLPFDTTDFIDGGGYTWLSASSRVKTNFAVTERMQFTAVVNFQAATAAPGSSRRMQVVQRDEAGANPVVLFDADIVPAQNRATTVAVSGIRLIPAGYHLEVLVSHNYTVLAAAQNLNVTAQFSVQRARAVPAPVAAVEAAYIDTVSTARVQFGSNAGNVVVLNNNDYVWAVCDATGKVAFGVRADGGVEVFDLSLARLVFEGASILDEDAVSQYLLRIADAAGHIVFGLNPDGVIVIGELAVGMFRSTIAQIAQAVIPILQSTSITTTEVQFGSLGNAGTVKPYAGVDDVAWAISDENGAIALAVALDGSVHAAELTARRVQFGALGADGGIQAPGPGSDFAWCVTDESGAVALGIAEDGTVQAKDLAVEILDFPSARLLEVATGTYAWALCDQAGKVALGVRFDGSVDALDLRTSSNADFPVSGLLHELNHVISYGQSLSIGVLSVPVVSSVQAHNSLRFVGGVRSRDVSAPGTYASLVPLVEQQATVGPDQYGETPCTGICEYVQNTLTARGLPHAVSGFQLLASAPGRGGQSIEDLDKGSFPYSVLIADVTNAATRAAELGKTYAVWGFVWMQGESDPTMTADTYRQKILQLRTDLEADIKAITGQTNPLKFIMHQPSAHHLSLVGGQGVPRIAQLQLDLALTEPHFYMANPEYFIPRASDNIHFSAAGSKEFGMHLARTMVSVLIDGKNRKPLHVDYATIAGDSVLLQLESPDAAAELVLDTTAVVNPGNFGFDLLTIAGVAINIASVTLLKGRRVKIKATATLPSQVDVRYAWRDTDHATLGPVSGARGNLRDDAGDRETAVVNGQTRPLHNWCPIFSLRVSRE